MKSASKLCCWQIKQYFQIGCGAIYTFADLLSTFIEWGILQMIINGLNETTFLPHSSRLEYYMWKQQCYKQWIFYYDQYCGSRRVIVVCIPYNFICVISTLLIYSVINTITEMPFAMVKYLESMRWQQLLRHNKVEQSSN